MNKSQILTIKRENNYPFKIKGSNKVIIRTMMSGKTPMALNNKLNYYFIKYPNLHLSVVILTLILIRLAFFSSITYCEGLGAENLIGEYYRLFYFEQVPYVEVPTDGNLSCEDNTSSSESENNSTGSQSDEDNTSLLVQDDPERQLLTTLLPEINAIYETLKTNNKDYLSMEDLNNLTKEVSLEKTNQALNELGSIVEFFDKKDDLNVNLVRCMAYIQANFITSEMKAEAVDAASGLALTKDQIKEFHSLVYLQVCKSVSDVYKLDL